MHLLNCFIFYVDLCIQSLLMYLPACLPATSPPGFLLAKQARDDGRLEGGRVKRREGWAGLGGGASMNSSACWCVGCQHCLLHVWLVEWNGKKGTAPAIYAIFKPHFFIFFNHLAHAEHFLLLWLFFSFMKKLLNSFLLQDSLTFCMMLLSYHVGYSISFALKFVPDQYPAVIFYDTSFASLSVRVPHSWDCCSDISLLFIEGVYFVMRLSYFPNMCMD